MFLGGHPPDISDFLLRVMSCLLHWRTFRFLQTKNRRAFHLKGFKRWPFLGLKKGIVFKKKHNIIICRYHIWNLDVQWDQFHRGPWASFAANSAGMVVWKQWAKRAKCRVGVDQIEENREKVEGMLKGQYIAFQGTKLTYKSCFLHICGTLFLGEGPQVSCSKPNMPSLVLFGSFLKVRVPYFESLIPLPKSPFWFFIHFIQSLFWPIITWKQKKLGFPTDPHVVPCALAHHEETPADGADGAWCCWSDSRDSQ